MSKAKHFVTDLYAHEVAEADSPRHRHGAPVRPVAARYLRTHIHSRNTTSGHTVSSTFGNQVTALCHVECRDSCGASPWGRRGEATGRPPVASLTGGLSTSADRQSFPLSPLAMPPLFLSEGFWRFPPHSLTFLLAGGTWTQTTLVTPFVEVPCHLPWTQHDSNLIISLLRSKHTATYLQRNSSRSFIKEPAETF